MKHWQHGGKSKAETKVGGGERVEPWADEKTGFGRAVSPAKRTKA
jgi:hypothetical protein